MRKILFFDTETTGKPLNYKAPLTDVNNWPRVTQLAWSLADETGRDLRIQGHLIQPDGWTIPEEEFFIKNGHTTERNQVRGIPFSYAMHLLLRDLNEASLLVAHNVQFDRNVLGAELYRHNKAELLTAKSFFCTMTATSSICRLPGARGGFKWPQLGELHQFLFNRPIEDAHDAGGDVLTLKNCFFELYNRKLINPIF